MLRINTNDPKQKWRLQCPECGSTNWRAHNGTFGCRACQSTVKVLVDDQTGEELSRDEIEFVGAEVPHKGVRSYPKHYRQ